MTPRKRSFAKTVVRKDKNAGNQHFAPYLTILTSMSVTELLIFGTFNLSSAVTFNLAESKILSSGKKQTYNRIQNIVGRWMEANNACTSTEHYIHVSVF